MLTSLSLRLRVFLMFLGMTAAVWVAIGLALYMGLGRAAETGVAGAFTFSGILLFFLSLAIFTGCWFLFDTNVAKPVERIAAAMRTRAHAGVEVSVDQNEARYLGDLGPAVAAVTGELSKASEDAEGIVAEETARLAAERAHLALLLTEIPVAIVLVSPTHQIMLYDGQAADVLKQVHVPRLSSSIYDYFTESELRPGFEQLTEARREVDVEVHGTKGNLLFQLRLKKLSEASGFMILIDSTNARIAPEAARPLIYDFDLTERDTEKAIENCSLSELSFTVFDTETTGLMPNKDDIVQIGAVRVVNGRMVPGERIDQLVDPGRPIPAASSKVHGISDTMVADAPKPLEAVADFHEFARESVIVAHNAPFDLAFLHKYGKVAGLEWPHPILDTVLLSAVVFGSNEVHTLDAVCDRLCIEIRPEVRHTALGDAEATAEALCKLLPILTSKGFETFGDVIQETRKHGRLLKDMN